MTRPRPASAALSRRLLATVFAGAALALPASPARASGEPGTTALSVLRQPVGARPLGMGGAFTAMDGDLYSQWYNPAGLGTIRSLDMAAMLTKGVADSSVQHLGVAAPLPIGLVTEDEPAVVAAGILFSKSGDIEVNTLNPDGSLGTSQTLTAGRDLVASFSIAQQAFTETFLHRGKTLTREHHFGLTGKIIHSTLAEAFSATAFAVDFGYLFRMPEEGLSIGASVLNLGPRVTFIDESDPVPVSYRGGLSWGRRLPFRDAKMTGALDFEHFQHEDESRWQFGVEYLDEHSFALRGGWRFGEDGRGLTLGLGFRRGNFSIDYAFVANSLFSSAHRIAFRLSLEPPWKLEQGKPKLRYEQILETPDLDEIKEEEVIKDRIRGEDLPLVPGWIR